MRYDLSLGSGRLDVSFDRRRRVDVLKPPASPEPTGLDVVRRAFDEADLRLEEFLKPGGRVCLVVSDYTRRTGSEVYVPEFLDRLLHAGVKAEDITVLIALGLHRPAAEEEMRRIVTDRVFERVKVVNHDPDDCVDDSGGAAFSRHVMEAGAVILTGVVSFHPMAGYSGGLKSLLPGVSSRRSVLENHRKYFLDLDMHPGVGPAKVDGNPVQEDIRLRCAGLQRLYCLNVVLDTAGDVAFAAAGTVAHAWGRCRDFVHRYRSVPIERIYDLVVASAGGAPLDYSFYQCMKVLGNASAACKEGGTLVILAQCYAGWEIAAELLNWFVLSPEKVARRLLENFRMDGLAVYMAMRVIRNHRIFFVSSLPGEEVRKTGMIPLKPEDLDLEGICGLPLTAAAAVMPEGALTLPILTTGG